MVVGRTCFVSSPGVPAYERLGTSYSAVRGEEPRIARQLHAALGDSARIVNVGAGTGSYEPRHRTVIAVEPSPTMLRQRPPDAPPAVQAVAESLPFPAGSFDASMASLTLHHWSDLDRGLAELRRVAPRQVVFFFEPLVTMDFWLLEYFPEIAELPTELEAPGVAEIGRILDLKEIQTIEVPPDCVDGFGAAYWARPAAYLDPVVQAGISSLALLSDEARRAGTLRLAADLDSGRWQERHGHHLQQRSFDGGYRLAIAGT